MPASGAKKSGVTFKTADGIALHGELVRVQRHVAIFELFSPLVTPRLSEMVESFKITLTGQEIYSGRAVIRNIVDAGTKIVCEATLDELDWTDLNLLLAIERNGGLANEFKNFLREWEKFYYVSPEFKVVIADMQNFLHDLRMWMEQMELKIQAQPKFVREESEQKILAILSEHILPVLGSLFEKFEKLIWKMGKEAESAYSVYSKRALHPLVLCSPFMRRTYEKPLGYAGDHEMVAMMLRNPFEGDSLFAKTLNMFFLNTPPVVAHCNRINELEKCLQSEILRHAVKGKPTRIFNLGCGPAVEIQRILAKSQFTENIEFTLLDFNDETVANTQKVLNQLCHKHDRDCMIRVMKKSVAQLLKENSGFKRGSFDLVYCAGLFDYLQDNVCEKLVELFYQLTAPGGLTLVTNVHVNNPSRGWMEYVVDWHLIYRDAKGMSDILPGHVPKEQTRIFTEEIGVNIFAEIRKPENA